MKFIKNEKLLKIVIIAMIGIMVGSMCYSVYLHTQLENMAIEKETIETQMDEIKEELASINIELHLAYEEIERQTEEIERYKSELEDEDVKWKKRYEEFPIATEAWIAMKSMGWNDIVCAGIMGNLMAETGGSGTLHLDWDSNGENGYGLVQWMGGRRSAIKKMYGRYPSVKEQIQFIHDELYGENGIRRQVTDSQLDAIMNAETPEECAYAFASYYERCASGVRNMRKTFARRAYDYFVG